MFKGKLIELPQLEHPPLIYESTLPLMIICLFFLPPHSYPSPSYHANLIKNKKHEILFKFPLKKRKEKEREEKYQRNPELLGGWG